MYLTPHASHMRSCHLEEDRLGFFANPHKESKQGSGKGIFWEEKPNAKEDKVKQPYRSEEQG